MRIEWNGLSIAVIAGEDDKAELSVRTNLGGTEANKRLEVLITKLSKKVQAAQQPQAAAGANNSPVTFKANGRRYMTIPGLDNQPGWGPIGLPSVDVFTGGVSFKYENTGMTQFSLTLRGDIDDVSSDILEKCNMLNSDQVPVDGGSGCIDAWKKWNLADTLLNTFGLGNLWENVYKEREAPLNTLSGQVIEKRNDILEFAKGLYPEIQEEEGADMALNQQRKAEIKKFNDETRGKVDALGNNKLNLDEDNNNVNKLVNAAEAEKFEKLAEDIRKQSDMFRSNASILFSLELLRAAYLGEKALEKFLGDYSRLPRQLQPPQGICGAGCL
jgi:hypothetical protein